MTIFTFIFGLAIFLFAMHNLEAGIRVASGQGLKNWIVGKTNSAYSSAACGVFVTAILQSSSMVSLIALAFVSAGVMPLFNGIGVVLGANLGTTITGWVVTIVGFKMDLQTLVVPMLGVGAACRLDYINNDRLVGFGKALFAFGLLIFGLDLMKGSVTGFTQIIDIGTLKSMPSWVYLLAGVFLAAVMQSSSAVMIISLSLLNSNMLQLTDAAAVVIGADLGTTSTTVLGSLGQSIIKKQLAFAHVFFNVSVNSLAYLILLPMLPGLLDFFSIQDTLFGLVSFHSLFNLIGVLVFLPLLKFYTRWIQYLLAADDDVYLKYFDVPVEVPDAAIDSLSAALEHLSSDAIQLNLFEWDGSLNFAEGSLNLAEGSLNLAEGSLNLAKGSLNLAKGSLKFPSSPTGSFELQYENLKSFEGDLVRYAQKLQLTQLTETQASAVSQMLEAARSLVYASKTLKDIRADIKLLNLAERDSLGAHLAACHQTFLYQFYSELTQLIFGALEADVKQEKLDKLSNLNASHHETANELVSIHMIKDEETSTKISTWFNLNHELHHYVRYMLASVIL